MEFAVQSFFRITYIEREFDVANTIKILEVEDEVITAMLMKRELACFGYDVISNVSTGENALKFVKDERPDVVLMDIELAGEIDGIDTAIIIDEVYKIPIIFITGYDDQSVKERADLVNHIGFFVKPVNMSKLQHIINEYFIQ